MPNSGTSDPTPFEQLMGEIKSGGHWRVVARPLAHKPEGFGTLSTLEPFALQHQVRLRRWHFPRLDDREPWRVHALAHGIEGGARLNTAAQCWRLYQSGQFAYVDALSEDYLADPARAGAFGRGLPSHLATGARCLELMWALYDLTEAFLFISRLAGNSAYEPGCEVKVELHGCKGRVLFAWDPGRYLPPLPPCHETDLAHGTGPVDQATMLARAPELALDAWVWFMGRFNFMSPARDVFREDQRKLLERRL